MRMLKRLFRGRGKVMDDQAPVRLGMKEYDLHSAVVHAEYWMPLGPLKQNWGLGDEWILTSAEAVYDEREKSPNILRLLFMRVLPGSQMALRALQQDGEGESLGYTAQGTGSMHTGPSSYTTTGGSNVT